MRSFQGTAQLIRRDILAINTGWQQRLEFLRRDAHHKILDPLQLHQWNAAIEQEVESGEYWELSG
jgi:hypothetical protein